MPDFELSVIENTQVVNWDFEQLTALFNAAAAEYRSRVYTSAADVKKDKTELSRVKKAIEDKRKEYKKQCLAPYEIAEKQIKQLTAIIDREQQRIVDEFAANERRAREENERAVKECYEENSACLGEYGEKLRKRIIDPKWLSGSVGRSRFEPLMKDAIDRAYNEMKVLTGLDSPIVKLIVDMYLDGEPFSSCLEKNTRYIMAEEAARSRAAAGNGVPGAAESAPASVPSAAPVYAPPPANMPAPTAMPMSAPMHAIREDDGEPWVTFRVKGSRRKTDRLKDFMSVLGMEFEEIIC
ncbi:MAG: DUF1351 domain-containing protein [Ruminococcus sp.]|nr:DUF1351 domain-containing protein [Ruminococcus sp.]